METKRLRPGPLLPLGTAGAAAALAPLVTGAPGATCLTIGTALTLGAGAILATWMGRRRPLPVVLPVSASLGALALSAAGSLAEGLLPWVAPAIGLSAGVLLGWSVARVLCAWDASDRELEELRARLTRREGDVRAQADRIRRLDIYDQVTGLFNRRGFELAIDQALAEAEEGREPLTLLLIEMPGFLPAAATVDGEHWGRRIGQLVREAIRGSDVAGRWDQDLIALLLPRCQDHRPAVRRIVSRFGAGPRGLMRDIVLAGVSVPPRGPWPSLEDLIGSALGALDAARQGPKGAEAPVWPLDWGRAVSAPGHRSVGA